MCSFYFTYSLRYLKMKYPGSVTCCPPVVTTFVINNYHIAFRRNFFYGKLFLLTPVSVSEFSLEERDCLMRLDGRTKPGGRSGIAGFILLLSLGDTCIFVMLSDFLRNSTPSSAIIRYDSNIDILKKVNIKIILKIIIYLCYE